MWRTGGETARRGPTTQRTHGDRWQLKGQTNQLQGQFQPRSNVLQYDGSAPCEYNALLRGPLPGQPCINSHQVATDMHTVP